MIQYQTGFIKNLRLFWMVFGMLITSELSAQVGISTDNYIPYGCRPQKILFKANAANANNYFWSFGDGTTSNSSKDTISHAFKHGGHYKIFLQAFNNTLKIGDSQFDVNIGGLDGNINNTTDSACIGEKVEFSYYPNQQNYSWNFGDPESGSNNYSYQTWGAHSYNKAGIYTVSMAANTNCGIDTAFKVIYVGNDATPKTSMWISSREACPGDQISLGLSNYNAKNIQWTFGEPSSGKADTSYESNPYHTYSTLGKHIIKLTVQNQCGHTATRTDSLIISANSKFSGDLNIYANQGQSILQGCPGDVFAFYTTYSAKNLLWKFGDGDSSNLIKPSHSYSANGEYIVSLKITNGCGRDTTVYREVSIGKTKTFANGSGIEVQLPYACPGDPISFTFNQPSSTYLWNFGDGFFSDKPIPTHSFLSLGEKTVTVKVTNFCGVDSVFVKNIFITDTLKPMLMHSNKDGNWGALSNMVCPGDSVMFYVFGGTHCIFEFGDGTISDKTSKLLVDKGEVNYIKYAYKKTGKYTVKLTMFNYCGNSVSDTITITVGGAQPIYGEIGIITNEPYYTCKDIQFMGTMGTLFTWYLPSGDSIVTDQNILNYSFSKAGTYLMGVKVENGCGNSAYFERDINIVETPKPIVYQQHDTLLIKSDAAVYQWYFNGDSIPGVDKSYCLAHKSGKYKVKITNPSGCFITSDEVSVCFVYAGEDISVCSGGIAQLDAIGTDNYSWSPSATLNNAAISNPTAQPVSDTKYIVTGTSPGCIAKDSVMVFVTTGLTANAGKDISICQGDSVRLMGSGGGSYSWSPSASLKNPETAYPIAKPDVTTTYTLTVSSGSCTNSDDIVVNVKQKPTLTFTADDNICSSNNAHLTATYSNAEGVEWKGLGLLSPDIYASDVYYQSSYGEKIGGYATIYVSTRGTGACPSINKSILIHYIQIQIPIIEAHHDTLIVPSGYQGYKWYLNGNIINGAVNNFIKASADGAYKVEVTNISCCSVFSVPFNFIYTKYRTSIAGSIKIYPNPVNDILNLYTEEQKSRLTIYSLDGKVINTVLLKDNSNAIPVNMLKPGAYILKIQGSNKTAVIRMIKE